MTPNLSFETIRDLFQRYGTGRMDGFVPAVRDAIAADRKLRAPPTGAGEPTEPIKRSWSGQALHREQAGPGEQPSELDHVECEECGSYYFCERCGCQTPELIFKARAARAVAVAAVDGREAKGSA